MVNLKYAIAIVMALSLFFITISIINFMDNQRLIRFTNDLVSFTSETQDLEYSLSLLKPGSDQEFCSIIDSAYTTKITKNNELMTTMLSYERASLFAEFHALKKQFLLSNVQLWRLSQLQREYCYSNHSDILYIYSSNPSCSECIVQGRILDSARAACPNARVFVMDADESLTSLDLIKKKYNVTGAPTLIIDGKAYPRVLRESEIKSLIGCS